MQIKLIQSDFWLEPYRSVIEKRISYFEKKEAELTQNGLIKLSDFATGYLYYGLHRNGNKWVFREWAPNATQIYLIGSFNNWEERQDYSFQSIGNGNWELVLDSEMLHHLDFYKLKIHWQNGSGERIPAYAKRVVQDPQTFLFSAQVWEPEQPYEFKSKRKGLNKTLLIYECHIGMAQEEAKVGSYTEFKDLILPRIVAEGYNAIQIMAIQEHPYYGSFGYHVSNFFACASRFGTPDELKALIDEAHRLGLLVIMDIVHSHSVKNENEGLAKLDGSMHQYFHSDHRREHPAWDSLCFDYGRNEVIHFLLSNCKFWLDEYQFDGFRFDGVTSMLYYNHGLGQAFTSYDDYFNEGIDIDALTYLTLANKLIHEVRTESVTIAEEMSGYPGLAFPVNDGGVGFDFRMAMGIPDFWIKIIKEQTDENWNVSSIFYELTNYRKDEKIVSYAESHDQALVGDKTIIFRLMDADMYSGMSIFNPQNLNVDRGIALHKIIRLLTSSTTNGAYLNFMGNEFGHPEWIDFPRPGNNWSHHYARRQWSLMDDHDLKYKFLAKFDKDMLEIIKPKGFANSEIKKLWSKEDDQILAFQRKDLIFIFNLSPTKSYTDYGILVPRGSYEIVLDSDESEYGGFERIKKDNTYFTHFDPLYKRYRKEWLKLYLPTRTAIVLKKRKEK
ncbi:MAG: alpha amylase C-terminal domain-containing protein [Bacteroidales bacterium]